MAASSTASNQITCSNPTAQITVTVTGGTPQYAIAWPNGTTGSPYTATQPGTYIATVTDNKGCTNTASATVGSSTIPPSIAITGGVLTCANPVTQVTATTNATNPTYRWAGPGILSGGASAAASVNIAGTYTVTVTNTVNGCTSTATATVTVSPTINAAISFTNPILCFGGSNGTLSANYTGGTGVVTYLWNTGATTQNLGNLNTAFIRSRLLMPQDVPAPLRVP